MVRLVSLKRSLGWLVVTGLLLASVSPVIAGVVRTGRVAAFSTDAWTLGAPGGSSRVVVVGDGDTDLDCYVYNRFGTLIGVDDDSTDYCVVDVYQRTSGNLRIEIRNLGRVWNGYVLSLD